MPSCGDSLTSLYLKLSCNLLSHPDANLSRRAVDFVELGWGPSASAGDACKENVQATSGTVTVIFPACITQVFVYISPSNVLINKQVHASTVVE